MVGPFLETDLLESKQQCTMSAFHTQVGILYQQQFQTGLQERVG